MAAGSNGGPLGLANLQEITANTGQADGLGRKGARVAGRHPSKVTKINSNEQGYHYKQTGDCAHREMV